MVARSAMSGRLMLRRDALRLGAAALVQGAAFLVGCKSRGNSPAATSNGQLAPVNIVNTASNNTYTLQELLKQLGYLENFGLAAQTLNVSDGSKLIGALLSGTSDICLLSGF